MNLRCIADGIATGARTPIDHIDDVLRALDALDHTPWANLIASRNDDAARAHASHRTTEIAAGRRLGPLDGIAVVVKDNIDVAGMPTRAGSNLYQTAPAAERDADIVAELRSKGAIVVGKSHLHELGYGSTGAVNANGAARHPLDPDLVTGGSSSGSAALVALETVPLAVGTDTGCSVRAPAALCNVAGLMPALGTLSTRGTIPVSETFDHVGLLAADTDSLSLAWMAFGVETRQRAAAATMRIGVPRATCLVVEDPVLSTAIDATTGRLKDKGHRVIDVDIPELDALAELYRVIVGYEMRTRYADVLERSPELLQPETRVRLLYNARYSNTEYASALARVNQLRGTILEGLRSTGIDALMLPTTPYSIPPPLSATTVSGESVSSDLLRLCVPFSVLGTSAISVPVRGSQHRPSVQLVGITLDEKQLLSTAAALFA